MGVGLAGCSGGEESTPEASTEEGTPESTEIPAPSLGEFEYPEGASQDGISNAELYSAHESAVTGAGSLTLDREETNDFGNGESTRTEMNQFASGEIYQEINRGNRTESIWSPTDEDVSYVQLKSGFENTYRIDNQAPQTNRVTGLEGFRDIILGAEWGEAVEVVRSDDGFAVVYDATGVANANEIVFSGEIDAFEATIAITESGYVSQLDYDLTVTRDRGAVETSSEATVTAVGKTQIQEPEWSETAADEGIQFESQLTTDGTVVEMEMVNGTEVPSEAMLSLSDERGRGRTAIPSALSVGDQLYVGLSESNELLVSMEQAPAEARSLQSYAFVNLRTNFELFKTEHRV